MKISLQNISKSFDGNPVIDIEQLVFESESHSVIMGNSGTGKSTLLNLISGIMKPDDGTILLGDTDISNLKEYERDKFRSQNVGYIFQNFNLLPELTVTENIHMAGYFSEKRITNSELRRLLKEVGIHAKANDYPSSLSMGQRQRVAIVRAIAARPGLILADEPTGALDRKNKEAVIKLLRNLIQEIGGTLILVTHDHWVSEQFETTIPLQSVNQAVAI